MATDWGQIAQIGLGLASNYASGRQQSRQNAAQFAQGQNSQAMQQNAQQNQVLMQMAQLELLRKQMQEQNRAGRAQQTALGDVMANVQDARIDAPSHITRFNVSGGLRPSALGPNARMAGQELSSQALNALQQGDTFMPVRPAGPVDLNAGMPGPESTFDKIMALAGTVGNAYQGYRQQQQQQQVTEATRQYMSQLRSYNDVLRMLGGGEGG